MTSPRYSIVFLTGFMGSGKSTLAPLLAGRLGYNLVDIDTEIERAAGRSITEIFRGKGEMYFREVETAMLRSVVAVPGRVVSLGGGTLTAPENLELVKRTGLLVYLKTSPEEIFKRMRAKTDRPLLDSEDGKRLDDNELKVRISALLKAREPMYEQAHLTIVTDDARVDFAVDEILSRVKRLVE